MSAIFILNKEPPKKDKFFIFLRSRYFVMAASIDRNVDVFWKTSAGFLKSVVLQLSQNIDKVMLIWISQVFFSVFHLHVTYRTLLELFRIALVNFVMFAVLKILDNLFSMQNSLNANNCWRKQNFENCPRRP